MTMTSTAPLRRLVAGVRQLNLAASSVVSVAPMGKRDPANILLTLRVIGPPSDAADRIDRLDVIPQQFGSFPIGTWGIAPDATNPKVPSGDIISATDRVLLRAEAEIPSTAGGVPPPEIPYRQVETSDRRLLPFVTENDARRNDVIQATNALAFFIPAAADGAARIAAAATLLTERGGRSLADVAAWRADRAAAPLLGSLGEGLGRRPREVEVESATPAPPPPAAPPRPPRVRALLVPAEAREPFTAPAFDDREPAVVPAQTTVSAELLEGMTVTVAPAPSLANVDARLLGAVPARLLRTAPAAIGLERTVVAALAPPLTRTVLPGVEVGAGRANDPITGDRLAKFAESLTGDWARVATGEIVVLELPDAARDADPERRPTLAVRSGMARIVVLGPAGGVYQDVVLNANAPGQDQTLSVPQATRSVVAVALEAQSSSRPARHVRQPAMAGWTADVPLPSATDGVLIGAGCVIDSVGRSPARGATPLRAGWVAPDELVSGETAVSTTFAEPIAAVAIALEGGAGDDLVLGIEGAERPVGPDGAPEPPILVAAGARSVLVFRIAKSDRGAAVTVTTGAARRLAGVVASAAYESGRQDMASLLAETIGRIGLAELVPPVVRPGPGGVEFRWMEP
jgi:hypothetical protein